MKIILSIIFVLVMTLLVGCGPVSTDLPITPTTTQQPSASARPTTLTPTGTATALPVAPTNTPTHPTPTPPPVAASPTATKQARVEISPPQRLSGHSGGLGSLAFSSDGTLLASTGLDRTIRLWDVASGQQKQVWQGGSDSMKGLDFSTDGQLLVSIEEDSTIALWDISSGQAVGRINPPGSTCGVEFSPDGSLLASGHVNGVVRLWETGSWKLVRELSGLEALSCSVTFSPDGSRVAAGGGETDIRVLVWDVSNGELLQNIEVYSDGLPQIHPWQSVYIYRIAFSPDGSLIASASGDRKIRLWEADSGSLRYTLIADREKLSAVDFSPGGDFLVSGGIDGSVRLWDVGSGQQLAIYPSRNGEIYSVVYSPVAQVFASAGEDEDVLVWHITFPAVTDFAAYSEALAATDQFSGALLVAQNGEILLEKAYGLANRASLSPNQVDTKFNLGSMNKMFTAVATLQLMEQEQLFLDATILQHLPDYPNTAVAEAVTIHQLLTHTSGLGDVFTEAFIADPHRYRSNADFLPLFVDEPLQFKPGEGFFYSNAGFVVLGLIIERVSGQSYDDFIQQNIFDPAGMANTGAFALDADLPGLALGYTTRDFNGNDTGILAENTPLIPIHGFAAGGGYSTVEDLFRFRKALFNFELLSPPAIELLLTGKIVIRENSSYAYGFMDRIVGGQRVVGHTGGAPGICSFLYMYPESGYTIAVLSNSDNGCVLFLDYLKNHPLPP